MADEYGDQEWLQYWDDIDFVFDAYQSDYWGRGVAYSNIAWAIYEAIVTKLFVYIKDMGVRSVYQFPAPEDRASYVGKYGRSCLVRLISDDFQDAGSNAYEERIYRFEILLLVRDTGETQKEIMDLAEEVKYAFQQVRVNGAIWQHLEVDPIEYSETEDGNTKQALLTLEVLRDG